MGELKDILLNFGAIAGFAGIVGLAVLAMLYFSQARDVRRLREWAGREPERAAEIELRAQQIASQAIAQAYESMAMRQSEAQAAAGIAHEQGVETPPLAAETEVAPPEVEPAVSEETQVHDVVKHEFGGEAPAEDAADAVEAREEEQLAEAEEEGSPQPEHVVAESTGAAAGETAIQPAPAGDDDDDAGEEPPSDTPSSEPAPNVLSPSTPAAARAASPLPPLPPLDTSEFKPASITTPPVPDYYLTGEHTGSHSFEELERPSGRSRVPFAVAGVLVAVFAVILIATQLVGGDDSSSDSKTKTTQSQKQQENTGAPKNTKVNRAAVTVSVLNGTDTSGIAAIAADGLNKAGFTDTTVGNLNDGTVHPQSTVYYASGNKIEAEEVANEMRIKDIKPATEDLLAKGGSVPVIVVLGADFDQ